MSISSVCVYALWICICSLLIRKDFPRKCRFFLWLLRVLLFRSRALQCVRVCIVNMYGYFADMWVVFADMQGVCVVVAYQSSYPCHISGCVYIYCG